MNSLKNNEQKIVFTRNEISIDLKNLYLYKALTVLAVMFSAVLLSLFVWIVADMPSMEGQPLFAVVICWICFAAIFLIIVILFVFFIFYLSRYIKLPKYKIVSDTYIHNRLQKRNTACFYHFIFENYGEYKIEKNEVRYKWIEDVRINGEIMQKTATAGEEYYLIFVKDKIEYIYSKRVFELK